MRLADHRRTIRLVIFVLGIVGVAIVFRRALDDSRGQVLPDLPAMAIVGLLTISGIVMAARAWTGLFPPGHDRRALAGSLYASQLTKYLPAGGVVQAAGQVSMSVTAGATSGAAAVAAAVWAFTSVVGGCVLSAGLVFATSLPTWARALSLLGLLAPVLLHRRVLSAAMHLAHRVVGGCPTRQPPDAATGAGRARVVVGNAVAGSVAYAVLLYALDDDISFATTVCAFALSWVVGFLVFPLPSGIGVREAVLVAIVPNAGPAALLGASLAQRLLVLASEVTLTVTNQVVARRRRRVAGLTGHRHPTRGPVIPTATSGAGADGLSVHPADAG